MDLGLALNLVTTATFVGAFIFGVVQVIDARRARQQEVAVELVRRLQTGDFARYVRVVLDLPEGIAAAELSARGDHILEASGMLSIQFSTLGYLVYSRIIPLRTLDDLIGGPVRLCWSRLAPWIEARRAAGERNSFDWFQWLAERLAEHPRDAKRIGAHVAYRDWKP